MGIRGKGLNEQRQHGRGPLSEEVSSMEGPSTIDGNENALWLKLKFKTSYIVRPFLLAK
jgi:hypothetical protein